MSQVAKPGEENPAPVSESETAAKENPTPAEPTVELSDEQKAYLKGIGIDDVNSAESIAKIIDTSIKQKSSVSRSSREAEELKARLASLNQSTEVEHEEVVTEPPTAPEHATSEADTSPKIGSGVSDNDLFDLTQMFASFPELTSEAQDGRIFAELRQLGYFSANGFDKKAIYNHLSARNSQAKELRELREFKEQHSKPDPSMNPQYNPSTGINLDGEMNRDVARAIILKGPQTSRYQEAREFLQKSL